MAYVVSIAFHPIMLRSYRGRAWRTDRQHSMRRRFSVRISSGNSRAVEIRLGKTPPSAPSLPFPLPLLFLAPQPPHPLTFAACPPFLDPFHPSNTNVFDCILTSLHLEGKCARSSFPVALWPPEECNKQALFWWGVTRSLFVVLLTCLLLFHFICFHFFLLLSLIHYSFKHPHTYAHKRNILFMADIHQIRLPNPLDINL